jgi:hypothetical protein
MSTTQERGAIYTLSIEIILYIFEFCEPDDFQTAALSCKWLYHAVESLIPKHNQCRRRVLEDAALERTDSGYTVIREPFEFLEWLITLPKQVQIKQLSFFERVMAIPKSLANAYRPHSPVAMDRLAVDFPSIYSHITHVEKSLWGAQEDSDVEDSSVVSSFDHDPADPSPPPSETYWHVLVLGLLPSLKSLVVHARTFYNNSTPFNLYDLGMLHGSRSVVFPHLKELYLINGTTVPYSYLKPIFHLPSLKLLAVSELGWFANEIYIMDEPENVCPIEKLILFRSQWNSRNMTDFLKRVPSLKSFTWEDCQVKWYWSGFGLYPDDDMDDRRDEDELRDEDHFSCNTEMRMRDEYAPYSPDLTPSSSSESDVDDAENSLLFQDHGLDMACSLGEPPEWPWDSNSNPSYSPDLFFKPSTVLQQLTQTHASTLQELAIGVGFEAEECKLGYWIERRHKIVHFNDFSALKVLEFDTRILRPRKGYHYTLPHLSSIVPPSVQVIGLIVPMIHAASTTKDLLSPCPEMGFPSLQRISIQLNIADLGFLPCQRRRASPCPAGLDGELLGEVHLGLGLLREQYKMMGALLQWSVMYDGRKLQPRLVPGKARFAIEDVNFRYLG